MSDPIQIDSLLPVSSSAANAWRHGMYARKVLVAAEDRDDFENLRDALVDEWRPRSVTTWVLVDHLAKLQWRLMRAGEAEAERLGQLLEQPHGGERSAGSALAWDAGRANSSLHRIQLFQMRLERSVHRVIGQLIAMRKLRGKRGNPGRGRATSGSAQPTAGPHVGSADENGNGRNGRPLAIATDRPRSQA